MKHFQAVIIAALMSVPAFADTPLFETEEAFAQSQSIRSEAIAAFRGGDLPKALERMEAALTHRPNSVALLANAMFLAAELDNTEQAIAYANRYAKMGAVPPKAMRDKLQEKLATADWDALNALFSANVAPTGAANTLFSVPTDFPLVEGIATDGEGTFFIGTVVNDIILRASASEDPSTLIDAENHAFGSFFGIAYSRHDKRLYTTFARVDQTAEPASRASATGLARIHPETGAVEQTWVIEDGVADHQIADIAVAHDGSIYLSDARGRTVYQLGGDTLAPIETSVTFMSPQGIVATDDGTLLLADYGRGIWLIEPETGNAHLLGVPSDITVTGIDGLLMHEGSLVAIQNGIAPHRIVKLTLNLAEKRIETVTVLAQNLPEFDEPTLGVSTEVGIVFVASSQWPKFGEGGTVRDGMQVNPTKIMRLSTQ